MPLALEPIAALFDWPDDELHRGRVPHRDPGAHRRAAAARRRQRVRQRASTAAPTRAALLDALPLERVAYVHVAGRRRARRALPRHAHRPGPAGGARPAGSGCASGPSPPRVHARTRRPTTRRPRRCAPSWTRSPRPPPSRRRLAPAEPRPGRGMTSPDDEATSAARQAELVAALVAGAPLPAGFDPDRLAVARRARCCASGPARRRQRGRCWPRRSGRGGTTPFAGLRGGPAPGRFAARRLGPGTGAGSPTGS